MVGDRYELFFSDRFRRRVKRVLGFEARSKSEAYAHKLAVEIEAQLDKLERLPLIHPILDEYPGPEELRYTKVRSYKIVFEVHEEEKAVSIVTIRGDAEDPAVVFADL